MRTRQGVATWGMAAMIAIACSFDPSFVGDGETDSTSTGASSQTTSTQTATTATPTSIDASSESTTSTTTAAAGTESEGDTGSTTEASPSDALAGDDAVIVRYFVDEQDAGVPEGSLVDAAGDPALDLPVIYDDGSMSPLYIENDGQRGLHWSSHGLAGRAQVAGVDTKLRALDGLPQATIELVLELDSVYMAAEPWARILVWQPDIVPYNVQMGLLGFWDSDAMAIDMRSAWQSDNNPVTGRWSLAEAPGRIVVHAVIDTTLSSDDRIRLFIDGQLAPPTVIHPPAEGNTLTFSEDAFLVLGNRPSADTSFGGTLYYAAIYGRALSIDEVGHNALVLVASDDTPSR